MKSLFILISVIILMKGTEQTINVLLFVLFAVRFHLFVVVENFLWTVRS